MTRSIFDPTGDDMIQEGDRFTGPTAQNISHVPPRAVDGKVGDDPDAQVPLKGTEDQGLSRADTERLAEAADDAVKEGDPDVPNPVPRRQMPRITDGEDGELAWMQDA